MKTLWLPRTVLEAFIVSMPKITTHHWSGLTLSMKYMFGIVPGSRYGWPKNILGCKGIHESILDICATEEVDVVIAGGIVAVEGNGPLKGAPRLFGKIVLVNDSVAADTASPTGAVASRPRCCQPSPARMGHPRGMKVAFRDTPPTVDRRSISESYLLWQ